MQNINKLNVDWYSENSLGGSLEMKQLKETSSEEQEAM
jgi:hypothetical protein